MIRNLADRCLDGVLNLETRAFNMKRGKGHHSYILYIYCIDKQRWLCLLDETYTIAENYAPVDSDSITMPYSEDGGWCMASV